MLAFGGELAVGELFFQSASNLLEAAEKPLAAGVVDDGGEVVVEQGPLPLAVWSAGEEDLEGVVAAAAEGPGPAVAEERFHLRHPLRVRGAAQAVTVGEEARPVFAAARVLMVREALAPQVFGAFRGVVVVRVPPQPGREHLVLIRGNIAAGDALGATAACVAKSRSERGARKLAAGYHGSSVADLRITDAGMGEGRDEEDCCEESEYRIGISKARAWYSACGFALYLGITAIPSANNARSASGKHHTAGCTHGPR